MISDAQIDAMIIEGLRPMLKRVQPPGWELVVAEAEKRSRHRRARVALPLFALVAAIGAATAIAASAGWIFSGNDQQIMGVTHVTLGGSVWRVTLTQQTHGGISFVDVGASSGGVRSQGGMADVGSLRWFGPPYTAARADIPGGSIWAGTTRPSIQRVSITDYAGHVYTTNTIAAPQTTKTPYRYWALADPGAPAETLTTYDATGKATIWRLSTGD